MPNTTTSKAIDIGIQCRGRDVLSKCCLWKLMEGPFRLQTADDVLAVKLAMQTPEKCKSPYFTMNNILSKTLQNVKLIPLGIMVFTARPGCVDVEKENGLMRGVRNDNEGL
jgi:hypothetical protein